MPELVFVAYSVVVGLVTILLPTFFQTKVAGLPWNAGPRDVAPPPMGVMGQRLDRARKNFLETYPLFLAAVLIAVGGHHTNARTLLGSEIYVWARLIYIPLYALGIPYVRTLAWAASLVGIGMIIFGALHT